MKLLHISELDRTGSAHFLKGLLPGEFLNAGGMSFKKPGQMSHPPECPCPACDGTGRHVHANDCEAFVILQGKAVMHCDGKEYPLEAGDIFIAEPGEDHHLVADTDDPCVNLAMHAGGVRHENQKE